VAAGRGVLKAQGEQFFNRTAEGRATDLLVDGRLRNTWGGSDPRKGRR